MSCAAKQSDELGSIVPAPSMGRGGAVRRGVRVRMAHAMLRIFLAKISDGQIVLIDGDERSVFGTPSSDIGLRATLRVLDPRFYSQVLLGGSLGAGETYLRGLWETDDLTSLLRIFVRNLHIADRLEGLFSLVGAPLARIQHFLRENTPRGSRRNIYAHYDLGNDFFALFLDETMTYSAGIFERADSTLRDASVAKLDRICRKLRLCSSDHVIEIGSGWGSFAIHAASQYGCRVTTTTISEEQHALATERVSEAGLSDRINVLLKDYRTLDGRYNKLVSIEMIEAVGHRFLDTYFKKCSELLTDDGAMLLQAITMPDQRYAQYRRSVDFIRKYIFPGSCVPSVGAMSRAVARVTDFRQVHLEDIGPHYATTLKHWHERFVDNADAVRELGYPEEFIRMWRYYLSYCEAGFAERYIGDVQILFAKQGNRFPVTLGDLERTRSYSQGTEGDDA